MTTITVPNGALITKDPSDKSVYTMDWSDCFATGVTLTSTWTITALNPSSDTALTKDNPSVSLLTTSIRLLGGTLGAKYQIDDLVVTDESPVQERQRRFFVLVQTK